MFTDRSCAVESTPKEVLLLLAQVAQETAAFAKPLVVRRKARSSFAAGCRTRFALADKGSSKRRARLPFFPREAQLAKVVPL